MSFDQEAEEESAPSDLMPLMEAFRAQLLACLEECAAGRLGLFTHRDDPKFGPWPEAERLRELTMALQALLAQQESQYQSNGQDSGPSNMQACAQLCDQFLDLCTFHGEADPGDPRLAREFIAEMKRGA